MSLRFFADHGISRMIIQILRDQGHEVFWLKEHIPANSPDELVISTAQQMNCILISLNGDFSDIIAYPPALYRGIIALQVRNRPEAIPIIMMRLVAYLSSHPGMEEYRGKLFLVEPHRMRVRI